MDISLVAKMKKYDEFISCYNEGDEKKVYKGKSLLFYSLSAMHQHSILFHLAALFRTLTPRR